MSQNPIATANVPGMSSHLDITAATLVKSGAGRLYKIGVVVAGSAAGTANDVATTGGAATANAMFGIPDVAGLYDVNIPFTNGLVIEPGTGQTLTAYFR